jgi:hypothetical protein
MSASQTKCSDNHAFLGSQLDLKPADAKTGSASTTRRIDVAFSNSDPQVLTLSAPVSDGDHLCLAADIAGEPVFSDAPATVVSTPSTISFSKSPQTLSKSVSVKGAAKDKIKIYVFDADYKPKTSSLSPDGGKLCALNDLGDATALASEVTLEGSDPQVIPLTRALSSREQLCIVDQTNPDDPKFSDLATVLDPKLPDLTIADPLSSDSTSVLVTGVSKASVSLYEFKAAPNVEDCQASIRAGDWRPLKIAPQGKGSSSLYSTPLDDTKGPYTITLETPPDAGSQICLQETLDEADGGAVLYSGQPKIVTDANNPYPRIRTFYTAGFMINNQNGSNSDHGSSTGAEYLDAGVSFTPVLETGNGSLVGVNTSVSARFSAIPVAAPPTSSTTSGNTGATSSDNGTLNILSSQSSFRMLGAVSFPVREGVLGCTKGSNCFFAGPVFKAGLDTLLNPAATATSGTDGSATTTVASFAPVYAEYSVGVRVGNKHYPNPKDVNPTPRTITQVDITLGKYSNLQSLVCNPDVSIEKNLSGPPSAPCSFPTSPGASTHDVYEQSRKTVARMEVNGFFVLPGSPFVLGFDANLPQTWLSPRHIGLLDNPGGNVALYFGVSGSLTSLFKGIKVPNFN